MYAQDLIAIAIQFAGKVSACCGSAVNMLQQSKGVSSEMEWRTDIILRPFELRCFGFERRYRACG
jgi:hypothetical protein